MQQAFDYLNAALFNTSLPPVILTLHRHPNTLGYFIPEKYRAKASVHAFDDKPDTLDEIALNPDMLHHRGDKDSLSTLAHEMCHEWIEHYSIPVRRNYHNKRWGDKMKEIGLYPSSTGMPGGKEKGSRVSHYIITGGRFDVVADKLLGDGFGFDWGSIANPPKQTKQGKRVKYVCSECGAAAWGKHGLALICGEDMMPMEAGCGED